MISPHDLRTSACRMFELAKQAARLSHWPGAGAAYWRRKSAENFQLAIYFRDRAIERQIEWDADVDLSLGREGLR